MRQDAQSLKSLKPRRHAPKSWAKSIPKNKIADPNSPAACTYMSIVCFLFLVFWRFSVCLPQMYLYLLLLYELNSYTFYR